MSALDLDELEALATERVAAEAADEPAEVAFKVAQEVARAAGIFGVWGRRETPAEEAASATFRAVRDQWHAAVERYRMARITWSCAAPSDAAALVLALITRLRAAEARTAWQPIETAPPPAEEWLHVAWVGEPGYQYARLDEHGWWVAESGRFYEDAYAETPPTHWCRPQQLTWTGALPAAPEAP